MATLNKLLCLCLPNRLSSSLSLLFLVSTHSTAKDKGEKKLFGFAFTPLMREDGTTLSDESHELYVYKVRHDCYFASCFLTTNHRPQSDTTSLLTWQSIEGFLRAWDSVVLLSLYRRAVGSEILWNKPYPFIRCPLWPAVTPTELNHHNNNNNMAATKYTQTVCWWQKWKKSSSCLWTLLNCQHSVWFKNE